MGEERGDEKERERLISWNCHGHSTTRIKTDEAKNSTEHGVKWMKIYYNRVGFGRGVINVMETNGLKECTLSEGK